MPDDFDSLLAEHRLQQELQHAADAIATISCAGIALSIGGRQRIAYTSLTEDDDSTAISPAEMQLGCLMKLFTATLVAQAVRAGAFTWDSSIADIAPARVPSMSFLDGAITLRHLLSHSHGWDDAAISAVPRCPDGRIDFRELLGALGSVARIAPIGRFYNYGNAGAWVCAALLEHVTGVSYRQLLWERLLAPLGCRRTLPDSAEPCPAADFNLSLPLDDALRFLELHLTTECAHDGGRCAAAPFFPEALRAWRLPLPGWSPSEREVCLGWKSYGSDWYGHNAQLRGYSALMRINPRRKLACAFFGKGERAFSAFARVFAHRLPEFKDFRLPKMLDRDQASRLDLGACEATFASSSSYVVVSRTADHRLQYRHCTRTPGAELIKAPTPLLPANGHVFFPADPARMHSEFPFLQFLPGADGLSFEYLWNGKNLWKRSPAPHASRGSADFETVEEPELDEESWSRLMGRC